MKKSTLLLLSLLFCATSLFAERKEQVKIERIEPDSTNFTVTGYRVRANHWSLMLNAGVGLFDGDQRQNFNVIWPRGDVKFSLNANVEYTFNPIWGIYANYFYNPYAGVSTYRNFDSASHGTIFGASQGNPLYFKGVNHEAALGVSLNMLNMFYRCRRQTWNWYMNVDMGVSFYNVEAFEDEKFENKIDELTLEDGSTTNPNILWREDKKGRSISVGVGTTVEYTPTDWLAILLAVNYRFHHQDSYEMAIKGNTNDNVAYAGLGLRWNIGSAKHKNRNHVRNMSMCQWEPEIGAELARRNAARLDSLEPRVKALEDDVNDLKPRVKALEDDMDKLRDSDEDGVPDIRDRHPNTPKGTPVNYYGEPIDKATVATDETFASIYFVTAKNDLNDAAHAEMAKAARVLYNNPELKLEIHGYCDEQGVPQYANQKLSERRAKIVRDALVKQYGVSADRIVLVQGHGAVAGPTKDYLPNRRTDMVLVR
ncbi:MAG: OmpA family protein [Paludibacteraceae bacterium]|nr:OmpA family protein [Paludibacteraceae bacterium]